MDVKRRVTFTMSEAEYHALGNDDGGFCLACGAVANGIEPDARKYECEVCGEPKVYTQK